MDRPQDRQLGFEVLRAYGSRALIQDVLQKMGVAVRTGGLLHGTNPIPETGRNARNPTVFDDEEAEPVRKYCLLYVDLGERWRRGWLG